MNRQPILVAQMRRDFHNARGMSVRPRESSCTGSWITTAAAVTPRCSRLGSIPPHGSSQAAPCLCVAPRSITDRFGTCVDRIWRPAD